MEKRERKRMRSKGDKKERKKIEYRERKLKIK